MTARGLTRATAELAWKVYLGILKLFNILNQDPRGGSWEPLIGWHVRRPASCKGNVESRRGYCQMSPPSFAWERALRANEAELTKRRPHFLPNVYPAHWRLCKTRGEERYFRLEKKKEKTFTGLLFFFKKKVPQDKSFLELQEILLVTEREENTENYIKAHSRLLS